MQANTKARAAIRQLAALAALVVDTAPPGHQLARMASAAQPVVSFNHQFYVVSALAPAATGSSCQALAHLLKTPDARLVKLGSTSLVQQFVRLKLQSSRHLLLCRDE